MRRAFTLLALLLLACGGSPEAPVAEEAPPPESVQRHMFTHYAHAIALREVVVSGNLSLLDRPTDGLGDHEQHAALPPSAAPFVERMNHAARRAGDARTLQQASHAVAEVALACGACHAAHDTQLAPSPMGPPTEAADHQGHMQRHHWATAKLWDGLVRPSWQDWKTGADALSEHQLEPQHLEPFGAGPETAPLIDRLHQIGRLAVEANAAGQDTRAAVFAELIGTCAGCHTRKSDFESKFNAAPVQPKP